MSQLGELTVATYCTNCDDFTRGTPAADGRDRCTECGCFASTSDVCCAQHEIRESPYPSGICPRCEQERSMRAQEQDMMERRADPQMHPTVDQKRF